MSRRTAVEPALIGTIEVPLAALWVWLAFAQTPRWSTPAGGAVVLAAVLWHVGWSGAPAGRAVPVASQSG